MGQWRPPKALRLVGLELASEASSAAIPHGIPSFDEEKDDQVRDLPSFQRFSSGISRLRNVPSLYGPGQGDRLALTWVYGSLGYPDSRDAWIEFWRELSSRSWSYWAIAPLHNFAMEPERVDFDDGLSIRRRSVKEIKGVTDWDDEHLDLAQDLRQPRWPNSRHVVVAEEAVDKTEENLVLGNTGTEYSRMSRLLLSMRLAASGDVLLGTTYQGRRGRFTLMGGVSSSLGWVIPGPGPEYRFDAAIEARVRRIYRRLIAFDAADSQKRYGHISIALSRFSSTFGRPYNGVDQLIDDVVCLEALVGTRDELAFTIAFRISGLLELDDPNRQALFRSLKSFYSTRSDVLHGAALKERARTDVSRERDLRDLVRRTLLGLLGLIGSEFDPTPNFMSTSLDDILMVPAERARLVAKM